jgi:hypothetical protein
LKNVIDSIECAIDYLDILHRLNCHFLRCRARKALSFWADGSTSGLPIPADRTRGCVGAGKCHRLMNRRSKISEKVPSTHVHGRSCEGNVQCMCDGEGQMTTKWPKLSFRFRQALGAV